MQDRYDTLEYCQAVVLGAVIQDPSKAPDVFGYLKPQDFYGQYQAVADTIHALRVNRTEISLVSIYDEMNRRGTLSRIGGQGELARISNHGFGDVTYAVQVIVRHQRLRRLRILADRSSSHAGSADGDPYFIAKNMIEEAQAVLDGIEADGDVTAQTLGEFLDVSDAPYDWVIPGLLERGDRFVLTGTEGLGKSVMMRQLAIGAASGIHPFTHEVIEPVRVLVVDCENGPVKLRRALRGLALAAERVGDDPRKRMFLEAVPQGLDLMKPEDEQWLVRTVSAVQPDLLITGPIYRLHAGNPNDEETARNVARVLDRCRAVSNCALATEAHAGHGNGPSEGVRPVRPVGSSLWLRWPEFGYGLRVNGSYDPTNRLVDLVPWRGDREERQWPKQLMSGGEWPWRAVRSHSPGFVAAAAAVSSSVPERPVTIDQWLKS